MSTYLRILAIVVGLCGLYGTYNIYQKYLHFKDLYEWNIHQIEELKLAKEQYEKVIAGLRADKDELIDAIKADQDRYEGKLNELRKHLKAPEIKKTDRESSKILKETIRGLR